MRARERQAFQCGSRHPRAAGECPAQRRYQCGAGKANRRSRKEITNVVAPQSSNRSAQRIGIAAVIPEDASARSQHPLHFERDLVLHTAVRHRAERGELRDQIEGPAGPWQLRGISTAEVNARETFTSGGDTFLDEIDAMQILGARSPLQKLEQPVARPTADVGDARVRQWKRAALPKQPRAHPCGAVLPVLDLLTLPGVAIGWDGLGARSMLRENSLVFRHGVDDAASIRAPGRTR